MNILIQASVIENERIKIKIKNFMEDMFAIWYNK